MHSIRLPARRRFVGVALAAAAAISAVLALPVSAQTAVLSKADERAVRAAVDKQLKAFLADDAPGAFAQAAPDIRNVFETPDKFLNMVRQKYPPLYRHQSLAFQTPEVNHLGVTQRLYLTDAYGESWVASYLMQQQPDKSWRIGACGLARNPTNVAAGAAAVAGSPAAISQ